MNIVESPSLAPPRHAPASVRSDSAPVKGVASRRLLRIATLALLAGVCSWLLLALFEGPLAQAWYTTRQHQLASEFAATRPHTGRGAAIGLLQIPALGVNLVVAEGDAPQQLRSGPAHRIGTPQPGAIGNSVIVGHRDGWGAPLSRLGRLKPGDLIAIQTGSTGGPIGVFKVQSVQHVSGDDLAPFANSTDRRLTIVTGVGGRYSDGRLAITAVSGPVGKTTAPTASTRATTSPGSAVWNESVFLALCGVVAATVLGLALHRRYRWSTVAIVVAPMLVLGLLGCLLNIDAALPPLG